MRDDGVFFHTLSFHHGGEMDREWTETTDEDRFDEWVIYSINLSFENKDSLPSPLLRSFNIHANA